MFWRKEKPRVYLDYASATPVSLRVQEAMLDYSRKNFGNASAIYNEGVFAKRGLETARKEIAGALFVRPEEIIFTSSGTESNNLAVFGSVRAFKKKFPNKIPEIIVSAIEHPSVLEPARTLENYGVLLKKVPVSENGIVDIDFIKKSINENTSLISVMQANNEIGTIEPVQEIGRAILRFRKEVKSEYPYFHTDTCQVFNYLEVKPLKSHADLVTMNASKIYGPKGIGLLYKREGVDLEPLIYGGGQEGGYRSGTEPVGLAVGFAEALREAAELRESESARLTELRDYFFKEAEKRLPNIKINGDVSARLPNNINISIPGIPAEEAILRLDARGFSVSAKSACASAAAGGSYVILALGGTEKESKENIRITMGRSTTSGDLENFLFALESIVDTYGRIHT